MKGFSSIEIQCRPGLGRLMRSFNIAPIHLDSRFSKTLMDTKFDDKNWLPYVSAVRFSLSPHAVNLAKELRLLG